MSLFQCHLLNHIVGLNLLRAATKRRKHTRRITSWRVNKSSEWNTSSRLRC
jgi:hypothetical protein